MGWFSDDPCCASCKHCMILEDIRDSRGENHHNVYRCAKGLYADELVNSGLFSEYNAIIALNYNTINQDGYFPRSCSGGCFEAYDPENPAKRNKNLDLR